MAMMLWLLARDAGFVGLPFDTHMAAGSFPLRTPKSAHFSSGHTFWQRIVEMLLGKRQQDLYGVKMAVVLL